MKGIPDAEYKARVRRLQGNIREAGLDAVLVHGNESDFANVRYLSEYWPTFEAAAVFVPAKGSPVLIIGPESETYARNRSKIRKIEKMVAYRESAEPEYPGVSVASFKDVVRKAMQRSKLKKLGIVSYSITPLPVLDALKRDLPGVKLIKADDTIIDLRILKSKDELRLMRKAFKVSEKAIEAILNEIKPGMT